MIKKKVLVKRLNEFLALQLAMSFLFSASPYGVVSQISTVLLRFTKLSHKQFHFHFHGACLLFCPIWELCSDPSSAEAWGCCWHRTPSTVADFISDKKYRSPIIEAQKMVPHTRLPLSRHPGASTSGTALVEEALYLAQFFYDSKLCPWRPYYLSSAFKIISFSPLLPSSFFIRNFHRKKKSLCSQYPQKWRTELINVDFTFTMLQMEESCMLRMVGIASILICKIQITIS